MSFYTKPIKKVFFFISFFTIFYSFSQENNFEQLDNEIWELRNHKQKAMVKVNEYIALAKKNNDKEKLFKGYTYAITYSSISIQLKYGDSLLDVATQLRNNNLIGNAYNTIGGALQNSEQYELALEKMLSAMDYYKTTGNIHNINTTKFEIGSIKKYLKDFTEAKIWLGEATTYFRAKLSDKEDVNSKHYYLYSLNALIDVNSRLGNFAENKLLIAEAKSFIAQNPNYKEYLPSYISSEGISYYYQKDYKTALKKLNEALNTYEDEWKHLTERFYIGMSFWNLGEKEKAIKWLKMIDEDYNETGKLYPEFRPAYDKIIDYYKEKNNKGSVLYFTEKALNIDRDLNKSMNDVRTKMHKEFDTPRLLEEKEQQNIQTFIIISSILAIGGFGIWLYYRKKLSKKTLELQTNKNSTSDLHHSTFNNDEENLIKAEINFDLYKPIAKETVKLILDCLQEFEKQQGFTEQGLKLWILAKRFHTTDKYLSSIIKINKGVNFNEYINNLRIAHFKKLGEMGNLNDISIKDIAQTLGFGSQEMFIKEFKIRHGITPRVFLNQQI